MLADASAFLPPPVAEISTDAAPDVNMQQRLISLAANYLQQIIPKLPNFFAERTTTRYQETAIFDAVNRRVEHEPMLPVESFKETILYRNGQEVADARGAKRKKRSGRFDLEPLGAEPQRVACSVPLSGPRREIVVYPTGLLPSRWRRDDRL
jgi:hypothetical protein